MNRYPFDRNKNSWQERRRRFLCPMEKNAGLSPEQILEKRKLERFLKNCASEVDIKLKKISLKDIPEVEVFFDIFYNEQKVCYLLKQWNSSIMCFGDTIKLRKDFMDFKERFYKIHHICAANYLTLLFPPDEKKTCTSKSLWRLQYILIISTSEF